MFGSPSLSTGNKVLSGTWVSTSLSALIVSQAAARYLMEGKGKKRQTTGTCDTCLLVAAAFSHLSLFLVGVDGSMTSFSLSPAPPNRRTPSPPILGPCYPWFIFRLYRTTVTIHAADRSLRCLHSLHSLLTHGHVKTLLCPAHFSRTT